MPSVWPPPGPAGGGSSVRASGNGRILSKYDTAPAHRYVGQGHLAPPRRMFRETVHPATDRVRTPRALQVPGRGSARQRRWRGPPHVPRAPGRLVALASPASGHQCGGRHARQRWRRRRAAVPAVAAHHAAVAAHRRPPSAAAAAAGVADGAAGLHAADTDAAATDDPVAHVAADGRHRRGHHRAAPRAQVRGQPGIGEPVPGRAGRRGRLQGGRRVARDGGKTSRHHVGAWPRVCAVQQVEVCAGPAPLARRVRASGACVLSLCRTRRSACRTRGSRTTRRCTSTTCSS